MAILEVEHINKTFGRTEVLKDISFSLERGQVLSLIGSSGSGKTTLLRCLNFLETPDKGVIRVNDELLFDAANPVTKQESEIRKKRLHFGLVFQSFNLFPQYTALGNVMLAKELLAKSQPDYKAHKKEIHAEIEAEAKRLLDQMGLSERMNNYPHQLSGGQCQRVAIARALALSPDILCFVKLRMRNIWMTFWLNIRHPLIAPRVHCCLIGISAAVIRKNLSRSGDINCIKRSIHYFAHATC